METFLHIVLIALFLACATIIYIGYMRVESWWHFRTWDKPHSTFNWPILIALLFVPVATCVAMLIRW